MAVTTAAHCGTLIMKAKPNSFSDSQHCNQIYFTCLYVCVCECVCTSVNACVKEKETAGVF